YGSTRLEVRWIVPGPIPASTDEWFSRFPARREERDDIYQVTPQLPDLAVKIRGGSALDVKEFHGTRGVIDLMGIGRGRLESWKKWSFSFGTQRIRRKESPGWRRVTKRRRLTAFIPDEDSLVPAFEAPPDLLVCSVELSEFIVDDTSSWTLAFESTGPEDRLREAMEATASRIVSRDLPAHLRLDLKHSGPYSEWISKLEHRRRTDRLWRQVGAQQ
ncbi:MAG TPA: hypothetical protein VKR22_06750, partial [Acidimicrobiales bacterium]|nr:hypothetical protein [Acidimicrobiales bacterium]